MEELLRRILDEMMLLRQGHGETQADIRDMRADIREMRADICTLKDGQQELRQGYDEMRADVRTLKDGQQELRQAHQETLAAIDGLRAGQSRLEEQITRLQMHIESEVTEKIRALYDARGLMTDSLDRIESRLVSHEERLERHFREIALLRLKAEEGSGR